MNHPFRVFRLLLLLVAVFSLLSLPLPAQDGQKEKQEEKTEKKDKGEKAKDEKAKEESARSSDEDSETTILKVEVVAGDKDEPVDNASVYVRFLKERTLAKDRMVEMNSKTSRQGIATLPAIPRGKILIQIIAPGWKTFGQWYNLDKGEQTIKIKLQKPPRWY